MRLLNVYTLKIDEFFENDIPQYSILSHTWGQDEASFEQWTADPNPATSTKRGFMKALSACELSRRDGFQYTWIDTVCINKMNNVELTEAMNSMFKWYQASAVCYAHLEDLQQQPAAARMRQLPTCRWFTRGWTLQELIAPATVKFYDQSWTMIGTKSELAREISNITLISETILHDSAQVWKQSVAQRMSWLGNRKTTVKEDIAYCMIGIFDLYMPLIYGEGRRAFTRLQEVIIDSIHDHTVFCWIWPEDMPKPKWMSFLAPSPAAFRNSGCYVVDHKRRWENMRGYGVVNLAIKVPLQIAACSAGMSFALLEVKHADHHSEHAVSLPLMKMGVQPPWGASREAVWRGDYPAFPALLPPSWGSSPHVVFLGQPGLAPSEDHPRPGRVSYSPQSWLQHKASPFAALVLQRVDPDGGERLASLTRMSQPCDPLVFFKPTRSPRVWHQSVEVGTRNGNYLIHLAAWLRPDGRASWRVGLDALEPHAPVSAIESQVAIWSSKVEFKVSGQRVDGVACFEFAGDGMDMVQHKLGSSEGPVVRPASFIVHLPRHRGFLE